MAYSSRLHEHVKTIQSTKLEQFQIKFVTATNAMQI